MVGTTWPSGVMTRPAGRLAPTAFIRSVWPGLGVVWVVVVMEVVLTLDWGGARGEEDFGAGV